MSKNINICLACLFALFLSSPVFARPPQPTTAPAGASSGAAAGRRDPAAIFGRVKDLTGELNLTADQKTKIQAIFEKLQEELKSTSASMKDATQQEKVSKFRELLGTLREQIMGVLDDTQKAQFNEKLQAMRQGMAGNSPTTAPARGPAAMIQRIQTALAKLDLNEDQKAKIQDVFKGVKSQIEEVHNQVTAGTLDRSAAQEKIRPIIEDARKKILDQLTPDQAQNLREAIKTN